MSGYNLKWEGVPKLGVGGFSFGCISFQRTEIYISIYIGIQSASYAHQELVTEERHRKKRGTK